MAAVATIKVEAIEQGIVRIIFNRPEKLNALSRQMLLSLEEAIAAVAADRDVRVVVLDGAGERAFVAGADIEEYSDGNAARFAAYQYDSRRVFDKLEALSKPTIAVVRGYALGGGFEIALCCDTIVCGRSARFGLPEGNLGLVPGGGGTQRLTRAVGRYVAADILLAGRRIDGERAYALGLASSVSDNDKVDLAWLDLARSMLKIAPLAQAAAKRLVRLGPDAPLPVAQALEQEQLIHLYTTADAREGIAAFVQKRSPNFKGV